MTKTLTAIFPAHIGAGLFQIRNQLQAKAIAETTPNFGELIYDGAILLHYDPEQQQTVQQLRLLLEKYECLYITAIASDANKDKSITRLALTEFQRWRENLSSLERIKTYFYLDEPNLIKRATRIADVKNLKQKLEHSYILLVTSNSCELLNTYFNEETWRCQDGVNGRLKTFIKLFRSKDVVSVIADTISEAITVAAGINVKTYKIDEISTDEEEPLYPIHAEFDLQILLNDLNLFYRKEPDKHRHSIHHFFGALGAADMWVSGLENILQRLKAELFVETLTHYFKEKIKALSKPINPTMLSEAIAELSEAGLIHLYNLIELTDSCDLKLREDYENNLQQAVYLLLLKRDLALPSEQLETSFKNSITNKLNALLETDLSMDKLIDEINNIGCGIRINATQKNELERLFQTNQAQLVDHVIKLYQALRSSLKPEAVIEAFVFTIEESNQVKLCGAATAELEELVKVERLMDTVDYHDSACGNTRCHNQYTQAYWLARTDHGRRLLLPALRATTRPQLLKLLFGNQQPNFRQGHLFLLLIEELFIKPQINFLTDETETSKSWLTLLEYACCQLAGPTDNNIRIHTTTLVKTMCRQPYFLESIYGNKLLCRLLGIQHYYSIAVAAIWEQGFESENETTKQQTLSVCLNLISCFNSASLNSALICCFARREYTAFCSLVWQSLINLEPITKALVFAPLHRALLSFYIDHEGAQKEYIKQLVNRGDIIQQAYSINFLINYLFNNTTLLSFIKKKSATLALLNFLELLRPSILTTRTKPQFCLNYIIAVNNSEIVDINPLLTRLINTADEKQVQALRVMWLFSDPLSTTPALQVLTSKLEMLISANDARSIQKEGLDALNILSLDINNFLIFCKKQRENTVFSMLLLEWITRSKMPNYYFENTSANTLDTSSTGEAVRLSILNILIDLFCSMDLNEITASDLCILLLSSTWKESFIAQAAELLESGHVKFSRNFFPAIDRTAEALALITESNKSVLDTLANALATYFTDLLMQTNIQEFLNRSIEETASRLIPLLDSQLGPLLLSALKKKIDSYSVDRTVNEKLESRIRRTFTTPILAKVLNTFVTPLDIAIRHQQCLWIFELTSMQEFLTKRSEGVGLLRKKALLSAQPNHSTWDANPIIVRWFSLVVLSKPESLKESFISYLLSHRNLAKEALSHKNPKTSSLLFLEILKLLIQSYKQDLKRLKITINYFISTYLNSRNNPLFYVGDLSLIKQLSRLQTRLLMGNTIMPDGVLPCEIAMQNNGSFKQEIVRCCSAEELDKATPYLACARIWPTAKIEEIGWAFHLPAKYYFAAINTPERSPHRINLIEYWLRYSKEKIYQVALTNILSRLEVRAELIDNQQNLLLSHPMLQLLDKAKTKTNATTLYQALLTKTQYLKNNSTTAAIKIFFRHRELRKTCLQHFAHSSPEKRRQLAPQYQAAIKFHNVFHAELRRILGETLVLRYFSHKQPRVRDQGESRVTDTDANSAGFFSGAGTGNPANNTQKKRRTQRQFNPRSAGQA